MLANRERTFSMEERCILASHSSEWMPQLHWAFQDDQYLYLVMEYAGGGDLLSVLLKQEAHCLTENEARFYIAETIVAVDSLHQMGYIHRDIKPNNILIDHTGHVKIADFGSCISIADAKVRFCFSFYKGALITWLTLESTARGSRRNLRLCVARRAAGSARQHYVWDRSRLVVRWNRAL